MYVENRDIPPAAPWQTMVTGQRFEGHGPKEAAPRTAVSRTHPPVPYLATSRRRASAFSFACNAICRHKKKRKKRRHGERTVAVETCQIRGGGQTPISQAYPKAEADKETPYTKLAWPLEPRATCTNLLQRLGCGRVGYALPQQVELSSTCEACLE